MEILVRQGGSQGASRGGSSSARSFDLARSGVVTPLFLTLLSACSYRPVQRIIYYTFHLFS